MEVETRRFYEKAAARTQDASIRQLLDDLAYEEREHEERAQELDKQKLPDNVKADEEVAQRRLFVLQIVQPGLAGLMDGSVSTLAPVFAAAFATKNSHEAFLVGLAASAGAGISMGFAEALSDDGSLTGRGHPWVRGVICGAMTALGGIGHTLPVLLRDFRVALWAAGAVVVAELAVITWVRRRYMDTPWVSAALQVGLGGALVFITGLGTCGIGGAYFTESTGAPAYAGVFAAWCDLREIVPLAFGYMMAAKVGTGIVAELGSMRFSDEIDALEVMGISGMTFLCATRLLAAWMVLPFMYLAAIGAGFFASWLAVVEQIGDVSSGGFFLIFWQFQNPPDLLFSVIKAMTEATLIVLVGCYYGYNASGGPVGVGTATAKSMVLNLVGVHLIGMLGTQLFWGANPRAPIGG